MSPLCSFILLFDAILFIYYFIILVKRVRSVRFMSDNFLDTFSPTLSAKRHSVEMATVAKVCYLRAW